VLRTAAAQEREESVLEEIAVALGEASGTMNGATPLQHL
jgi:hypothetical protein